MNHSSNVGVFIHLAILAVMIIGVCYIGYKLWTEESPEYKEWKNDNNI